VAKVIVFEEMRQVTDKNTKTIIIGYQWQKELRSPE
jgi:hypothetical protein